MKRVLLWFRRDLRLHDNPALDWAVRQRAQILPVYIHSPLEEAPWPAGGASRWWLYHSLRRLEESLARKGLQLHYFSGNACEILPQLVRGSHIDALAANRLYEPHLAQRDAQLSRHLGSDGVRLELFDSALLLPPAALLNKQGKPYRVFTPFWRMARQQLQHALPPPAPPPPEGQLPAMRQQPEGRRRLEQLELLDGNPWHDKLHGHWRPGEQAAQQRLEDFLDGGLAGYESGRDYPARQGSSRLSPHLHFGEVTPAQIYHSLAPLMHHADAALGKSIERLLSELGWREFAHYVLWHFPYTSERSMNPRYRDSFWREDAAALQAWQHGRTGVPLVDAGMRELWETGWMHNRVRMVAASFLTKNLGIHWLHGARWFWDTLVDADLASNSLGWQWVAGTGVDAAPYYRIFNPVRQAERFDPEGAYLQRWGTDLPCQLIVDLAQSRTEALQRYQNLPPPGEA